MKKYMILLFWLLAYNLCAIEKSEIRRICFQRQVPQWEHEDEKLLSFIINLAAVFAKSDEYHFKKYRDNDLILFKVYNQDCSFCLLFNSKTRECDIQFNAYNETFDYVAFKKMIDFFFIDN